MKVTEIPGEARRVYKYPLAGYQERDGSPAWQLSSAGTHVGEVTVAPKPTPSLDELDNLVTYGYDPDSGLPPDPWQTDAASLEQALEAYWSGQPAGPSEERGRYFHHGHLGGPPHVSNESGDLVAYTLWHPYGLESVARGFQPSYGFTGAEREPERELGLIQMGARWYSPRVGRWLSPDPLFLQSPEKAVGSPLEMNLYSYASSNPVAFVDPDGLCTAAVGGSTTCGDLADAADEALASPERIDEIAHSVTPDMSLFDKALLAVEILLRVFAGSATDTLRFGEGMAEGGPEGVRKDILRGTAISTTLLGGGAKLNQKLNAAGATSGSRLQGNQMQGLPARDRPGASSGMILPDGTPSTAASVKGGGPVKLFPSVQRSVDKVIRAGKGSAQSGRCAETVNISKNLYRGKKVRGAVERTTNVRAKGNKKHGKKKHACPTCKQVKKDHDVK